MRVVPLEDNSVPVTELKVGQIAKVVQWEEDLFMLNKVVVRYKTALVLLGVEEAKSYPQLFKHISQLEPSFLQTHRIVILDPGTILEI